MTDIILHRPICGICGCKRKVSVFIPETGKPFLRCGMYTSDDTIQSDEVFWQLWFSLPRKDRERLNKGWRVERPVREDEKVITLDEIDQRYKDSAEEASEITRSLGRDEGRVQSALMSYKQAIKDMQKAKQEIERLQKWDRDTTEHYKERTKAEMETVAAARSRALGWKQVLKHEYGFTDMQIDGTDHQMEQHLTGQRVIAI